MKQRPRAEFMKQNSLLPTPTAAHPIGFLSAPETLHPGGLQGDLRAWLPTLTFPVSGRHSRMKKSNPRSVWPHVLIACHRIRPGSSGVGQCQDVPAGICSAVKDILTLLRRARPGPLLRGLFTHLCRPEAALLSVTGGDSVCDDSSRSPW